MSHADELVSVGTNARRAAERNGLANSVGNAPAWIAWLWDAWPAGAETWLDDFHAGVDRLARDADLRSEFVTLRMLLSERALRPSDEDHNALVGWLVERLGAALKDGDEG